MTTRHPEAGMAMMTALVTLLLVTVIGLSLTAFGMLSVTVATNDRDTNEALAIADAGMTHAKSLLLNQVWIAPAVPPGAGPYDQLLVAGNGTACDGDEFSAAPANASQPYPPAAELIPAAGRTFPNGNAFGGRYVTSLCDDHTVEGTMTPPDANINHDHNGRIIARSHGFGRNSAEAWVEAVFDQRSMPALLVNGNLRINGGVEVLGVNGSVHANGSMDLNGTSACIQQYYSAVGSITPINAGNGGSCPYTSTPKHPGSDPLPVPKLDLTNPLYMSLADYWLINGNEYCGPSNPMNTPQCPVANGVSSINITTGAITSLVPVASTTDFNWNNGQKKWTSNNPAKGTYYSDMNVGLGGNFTKDLTIFARGWIDITGSPNITPDMPPQPEGAYAMVAGTDLMITGDLLGAPTFTGLYYARDQIRFSGNATVTGLVVSGNFSDCRWPLGAYVCDPNVTDSDNDNLVKRDADGFVATGSGSITITYNDTNGWKTLRMASWRECRGADPANPCGNP